MDYYKRRYKTLDEAIEKIKNLEAYNEKFIDHFSALEYEKEAENKRFHPFIKHYAETNNKLLNSIYKIKDAKAILNTLLNQDLLCQESQDVITKAIENLEREDEWLIYGSKEHYGIED